MTLHIHRCVEVVELEQQPVSTWRHEQQKIDREPLILGTSILRIKFMFTVFHPNPIVVFLSPRFLKTKSSEIRMQII